MANINITSDAWTEISITSGTIQNISATADIELSAEQTDNSGVVLKPSELYQWDNETIYARAVTEDTGALRVVNFKKAAGGGGSYVLPVATASKLGGVKIGNNLTIDENGVLSATGGGGAISYSTTEHKIGTWIDGKPVYQCTFTGTLGDATSASAISNEPQIDLSTYTIDCVIDIRGVAFTVGSGIPISTVFGINTAVDKRGVLSFSIEANPDDDNKAYLWSYNGTYYNGSTYHVTILYTKTTD